MTDHPAFTTEWDIKTQTFTLTCHRAWTRETLAAHWTPLCQKIERTKPSNLIINAQALTQCDSAGIALLLSLKREQTSNQGRFLIKGLSNALESLFTELDQTPVQNKKTALIHFNSIEAIGKWTIDSIDNWKKTITFIGELSCQLKMLFTPHKIRWQDVGKFIEQTGPNAVPIVLLLGFLVGLIISFQSAIPLQRFGAVTYVANLVGISLTRELGPLMVAIILAGRTASAFAAEIGTMKVNQEIDALKTFALEPLVFLALPRIIAVMLMAPLLTIFMIASGLLGSAVFMMSSHYAIDIFYRQVNAAVTPGDLWGGLFKSFIFGLLIAATGCKYGLETRFGASAVGDSTTKAVVSSIITIVIADGLFAVLFYILGF